MFGRGFIGLLCAVLVALAAASGAAAATQADSEPPSAPTQLTVDSLGGGIFWLEWNGSVDNVDGTRIHYPIYADTTLVYTTGGETTMVICLDPGTYAFTVRAIDSSGNLSAPSDAVEVSG